MISSLYECYSLPTVCFNSESHVFEHKVWKGQNSRLRFARLSIKWTTHKLRCASSTVSGRRILLRWHPSDNTLSQHSGISIMSNLIKDATALYHFSAASWMFGGHQRLLSKTKLSIWSTRGPDDSHILISNSGIYLSGIKTDQIPDLPANQQQKNMHQRRRKSFDNRPCIMHCSLRDNGTNLYSWQNQGWLWWRSNWRSSWWFWATTRFDDYI